MSVKAAQKAHTHETILQSAARLVRDRGIAGTRVADVMDGAGLTVGGFYAHFSSKQALVDEVIRRAATRVRERLLPRAGSNDADDRLGAVLRRYLSTAHRDQTGEGCPFPSVVGEIATTAPEHREVLAEQVKSLARHLEPLVGAGAVPPRQQALAVLALMFGGLTLARALRGTPLSDELLKACRAFGQAPPTTTSRTMIERRKKQP
jgi:TetR/AcrR family transcriptional repressor of nem operon